MLSTGGQVGADSNALTSVNDTQYFLEIPIDQSSTFQREGKDLDLFTRSIDILQGWAFRRTIFEPDVGREAQVRLPLPQRLSPPLLSRFVLRRSA